MGHRSVIKNNMAPSIHVNDVNIHQITTARECIIADACDALRNGNTLQIITERKSVFPYAGYTTLDLHVLNIFAILFPWRTIKRLIFLHRPRPGNGQGPGGVQRPGEVLSAGAGGGGVRRCGRDGEQAAQRRQKSQQGNGPFHNDSSIQPIFPTWHHDTTLHAQKQSPVCIVSRYFFSFPAKKPPFRAAFVHVFGFSRGLTDPGRRPASWRKRRGWRCRWAGTPRRSCRRRCRPSAGYRRTRRRRTRSGHCRGRREPRRRT